MLQLELAGSFYTTVFMSMSFAVSKKKSYIIIFLLGVRLMDWLIAAQIVRLKSTFLGIFFSKNINFGILMQTALLP